MQQMMLTESFVSEYWNFWRAVVFVFLLLWTHLIFFLLQLQSFVNARKENQVKLANILLIANRDLICIVIDDRTHDISRINVFAVGGNHISE